jgi:hypothetical protein
VHVSTRFVRKIGRKLARAELTNFCADLAGIEVR